MPIIRLILLLGIAATLLLFALQNWTPSMQLVFLGIRSPAFPLALWVLGAIAAGILTALVIAGLFRLTGFTAQRQVRGRKPASFAQNPANRYAYQAPKETEPAQTRTAWQAKPPSASVKQDEDGSDWEDDASDWFDDEADDRPKNWEPDTRRRTDYQAEARSDSSTEKPESVVDADFRVIVPPYRNLDRNPTEDDFDK
ncbi:hypothetical protein C7B65_13390 [Phormidesmis priestleyi ULC007]|uniref:DUF1049 domain-containing protein n=2 Tax=Phormidesmis priestleyi TaxID=268141 RepID=A0A2T1DEX3_9CYAN|nr:hypothetical protein C7B65_13390 [Phormidesmis priestleyi ULC007]PZO53991.1 MAG: hypothetical protein DCF14_03445 [Phormidesmis priestleyi]